MILFLKDWSNYPTAIVDTNTSNTTYLRLAGVYKRMGIKNHSFILALHNPNLVGIDPYSKNLTQEQIIAIVQEAKENPWYFFREVLRVPAAGSIDNVVYRANRSNVAMHWLYLNHITTLNIAPRQIGKTMAAFGIMSYVFDVAATGVTINLFTKDDDLRVKSMNIVKEILDGLPYYFKLKSKRDTYNTERLTIERLGNTFQSAVGQMSPKAALNVGRGMTIANNIIDELAFIPNIEITLPALLAASGAARDSAKALGVPYGNIFLTTPGYLSSSSGRFAYNMYNNCCKWTETLLDAENEEQLEELIRKNSPGGKLQVLCEFNHRQLGFTDDWLRRKIEDAMADGENVGAEFLNIWGEGNEESPISKEHLKIISNSAVGDPITTISPYGYITKWYVPQQEVDNKCAYRKLIMGLDTSDAVGNDDIAMCIRDVSTGEVIATGVYNETNLIVFSEWIATFLEEYPNITLVIERRSSGVTIIDNLLLLLVSKGIDPFRRIFNWVTNDATRESSTYREVLVPGINGRARETYTKYRKHFGYATSSAGKSSRDNLYGLAFNASIRYTASLTRDKTLISQLSSLVRKNGRIDHAAGKHDDMVIAYLLPYWFLTQAKNLQYYNILPKQVLTKVAIDIIEEQGGIEAVRHREVQSKIAEEIDNLSNMVKMCQSPIEADRYIRRAKMLANELDSTSREYYNITSLLESLTSPIFNKK